MRLQHALDTLLAALHDFEREAPAQELAAPRERALPAVDFATIDADESRWRELALYDLGHAAVRVAGSKSNREHFAVLPPGRREDKEVKLYAGVSALMALRSRVMASAAIRATDQALDLGELAIPDRSLTFFEGEGPEPAALLTLRESGVERHFVAPAGARERWRTAKVLDPRAGDALVEMRVPPALRSALELPPYVLVRAIEYHRPGYPSESIITSLTDAHDWPRHEIAAIHSERFASLENVRIASGQRRVMLPAETPPDALHGIWSLFAAYNLVRVALFHAARSLGHEPGRMDFAAAVNALGQDALRRALASGDATLLSHVLTPRAAEFCLEDPGSPMRLSAWPIT